MLAKTIEERDKKLARSANEIGDRLSKINQPFAMDLAQSIRSLLGFLELDTCKKGSAIENVLGVINNISTSPYMRTEFKNSLSVAAATLYPNRHSLNSASSSNRISKLTDGMAAAVRNSDSMAIMVLEYLSTNRDAILSEAEMDLRHCVAFMDDKALIRHLRR